MIEIGAVIEGECVEVHPEAIVRTGAVIKAEGGTVRIGRLVSVNPHTYIGAALATVSIGENTSIAPGAVITAAHHHLGPDVKRMIDDPQDRVEIGANCLIGANVTVQFGARVPDDVVIGANSLVTRSSQLRTGYVYGGVPVRELRRK
jgi:carbonic anhydrase/acetyltransferase-like protein (isoleucine patch superfamily)